MSITKSFSFNPLTHALTLLTIAPLLLISENALAVIVIDGAKMTIDGTAPLNSYLLQNRGDLTANNAVTQEIVLWDSSLSLNGTQVNATGFNAITGVGVRVATSTANIVGSRITSEATGLLLSHSPLGKTGSTVSVSDSTILGGQVGAGVNGLSHLTLVRSTVTGTNANGMGVRLFAGRLTASDSVITGGGYGIQMVYDPTQTQEINNLELNNSHVTSLTGPALSVDTLGMPNDASANIAVLNGSTLTSGNGNLLEVHRGASANIRIGNSTLVGDVVADADSSAAVVLEDRAVLTGRLTNVANLAVNSGASWNMVADASVATVNMDGGMINFNSGDAFRTLTLDTLAGNGNFGMGTNLATYTGDLLKITGNASGDFNLHIKNTGVEPVKGDESLKMVETGGGDAKFGAAGGKVDVGTYQYVMEQQGNDWYLVRGLDDTGKPIVTPSTDIVLGLFSTAPTVWYGEMSSLRSRMGELRMGKLVDGAWVRTYGRKYDVSSGAGLGYSQNQYGFSAGTDKALAVQSGQVIFGGLAGYSKSDLDFGAGTTGKVDSYYVGTYATWIADNGYYLDALVKLNNFRNQANVRMSDGTQADGNYSSYGVGTSVEFGRRIALSDNWFVEPMGQLSALWVKGDNYALSNGLNADNGHTNSVQLKLGASFGRTLILSQGSKLQPYLKAAVVQEFAKHNDVNVNDNKFNNDLSGTRGEVGVGIAAQLRANLQLHADADYSKGTNIRQPWGINIGVRYNW